MRAAIFGLLGVTVVLYAAVGGLMTWPLAAAAGGALPFDMRVFGYDLGQAQGYLRDLNAEGLALYRGWVRVLDTTLPIMLTLVLLLPLAERWVWGVFALGYGLADLAENAAVAGMLRVGEAGVTADQVAMASGLTQAKFGFLLLAFGAAIYGMTQRKG